MPLIRYDIGDRAVLKEYHAGTHFAKSLANINGRVDDVITTKEGVKVGRLDPLFKGLTGIKEAQIVQHSFEEIEIRLVPFKNVEIDEDELIRLLRERVGETFNVTISYYDLIPRSESGKFRSVVSKI
jgi:phenylacetate-CoA ligase